MNNTIFSNIVEARKAKGMTQQELADRLGVTYQAISSWERGLCVPDTWNLIELAKALDVSVSSLVEQRGDYDYPSEKIFYNWRRMKTYVQTTAKTLKMENTLKALPFAQKAHEGQTLKQSDIPYISHPLNMACHMLAMGIKDDALIAATLMHDVVEDCGKKRDDLPVDEETKELVMLMSHGKDEEDREAMLRRYYKGLASNPKAALIKLVDRCNNLTKMSWGLSRERIYRMIRETDEYVLPLLRVVKNTEYDDAAWLLSYQIRSMLDIYKRLM